MLKRLLFVLSILALLVTAVYFIVTTVPSVRYWADDFCSATLLRNNGYLNSQIMWWKSWTGRYSYIAFLDLFELMGPWVVRILPLILLTFLVVTLALFSNFLLATLFIVLTLINSPNIIQSFYWQTGSLNYTIPFVFFNLFISLLFLAKTKRVFFIAPILTFIAGGFSESFALAQGVLLFFMLLMIMVINPKDKIQKIKITIAGIAGTVFSLIIMSLAPGNAARAMTVTQPESLIFVLKSIILGTKWYLLRMLTIKPFVYSLAVLAFSVFFFSKKYALSLKRALIIMALSGLAAIFTTAAVIGAGFYSMSITPPERTMFIVVYMIFICFLAFSFCVKILLNSYLPAKVKNWFLWGVVIANLIATFFLIKSTLIHWSGVRSEIVTYAGEWDREEKNIPIIKNIKPVGELDSFTDNKGWVTGCITAYYGFDKILIKE